MGFPAGSDGKESAYNAGDLRSVAGLGRAPGGGHGNPLQHLGFPHSSVGKESACDAGDLDLIPGWERSPGEGNSNSPQYSCLENPMDREAW